LENFLEIAKCDVCELDLRESNPADGLSTLIFLITGGLGCLGIIWCELAFHMAPWLLILIWLPIVGVASIVALRPFKGLMVALLYKTQAGEAIFGAPRGAATSERDVPDGKSAP
jgi:uncharacterized protein (DUF983 family)